MKLSKCLALAALPLSITAYAQTSQTYHFGEGQTSLQTGNAHPATAAQPAQTQMQSPPPLPPGEPQEQANPTPTTGKAKTKTKAKHNSKSKHPTHHRRRHTTHRAPHQAMYSHP